MDNVSKNAILERIEDTLSYILSKKYDCNIKIYLKKDEFTNVNSNKTSDIREQQILDR